MLTIIIILGALGVAVAFAYYFCKNCGSGGGYEVYPCVRYNQANSTVEIYCSKDSQKIVVPYVKGITLDQLLSGKCV